MDGCKFQCTGRCSGVGSVSQSDFHTSRSMDSLLVWRLTLFYCGQLQLHWLHLCCSQDVSFRIPITAAGMRVSNDFIIRPGGRERWHLSRSYQYMNVGGVQSDVCSKLRPRSVSRDLPSQSFRPVRWKLNNMHPSSHLMLSTSSDNIIHD